ncbi:MAG: hypothetical protein E6G94_00755 [Alphaproteobacteria bacterium]|nr:MAG: hypothetical protein E6G94_00755 [Alphaproteobacteria bacterium]
MLAPDLDSAHRILLTGIRSVDWQSLTFAGERHEIDFRFAGPNARAVAEQFLVGLADAEFCISGHIVADIAGTIAAKDGIESVSVAIEALTISEN